MGRMLEKKGKEKEKGKWVDQAAHGYFGPKKVREIRNPFLFSKTFSKLQNYMNSNQFEFRMTLIAILNLLAHNNTKDFMQQHEMQQTNFIISKLI
jgi:hypothetical protein